MLLAPTAEPSDMKLTKEMDSLDADVIGNAAIFLLEAPCNDNGNAILQQDERVATIREAYMSNFKDADALLAEAEDVAIFAKAVEAETATSKSSKDGKAKPSVSFSVSIFTSPP